MSHVVLWLILVSTLVLMSYKCHGCKIVCKTSSGLHRHLQHCPQARSAISEAARQRQAIKAREEAAKIARRTGADVAEERQQLLVAEDFVVVRYPITGNLIKILTIQH
jgi:hypothetical protein